MKRIVLLGSTGSVGRNVLEVVRANRDKFKIIALSSNDNTDLLADQAKEFNPHTVAVRDEKVYGELKKKCPHVKCLLAGEENIESVSRLPDGDIIFIAIAGTAALKPLVSAIKAGKQVAIASKEPIVSAGSIINNLAKKYSASILPVDSEHSAITQCIGSRRKEEIDAIYLTASGGPLWKRGADEFNDISIEDVLKHPKWNMGPKITVDSATMMNKGLEIIEARWLFDINPDNIKIVVHPEAFIHSMVGFVDGTILACMSVPDMKFPILKAMSYPDILPSVFPRMDFSRIGKMSFYDHDGARFPAVDIARNALRRGGLAPAVLNGANESGVHLFLDAKIQFQDIISVVKEIVENHEENSNPTLDEIIKAETWARREVFKRCRQPL